MPPQRRRRKVICDVEEVVPAKKSRLRTETTPVKRSTERKSSSKSTKANVDAGPLSPAKKLRGKLNLKEGLAAEGESRVNEEEDETESKYFRGDDGTDIPRRRKELKKDRNKLNLKKSESGRRGKLGRNGKRTSVEQAERKGDKRMAGAEGGIEEEPRDEGMEEDGVSFRKRKSLKQHLSKSEAKADHDPSSSSAELNKVIAKKSRRASSKSVTCPVKKCASAGGGQKGGGKGGRGKGRGGSRGGQGDPEGKEEPPLPGASSSSESEWEEVEELPGIDVDEPWKSQLPDKPLQITLDASELVKKKRKKGGFDVKEFFRLQLNRFRTETQRNAHKVHLLCLLSHGRFKNAVCCSVTLQSIALSLVPPEFAGRSCDKWMLHQLMMFTRWFRKTILIDETDTAKADPAKADPAKADVNEQLSDRLISRFSERKAQSQQEFILMFTICSRSIGLFTRLVYSLQPITFKAVDLRKKNPSKTPATSEKAQKKKTDLKKKSSKTKSQKSGRKSDSTTNLNSQEMIRSSASVSRNSSAYEENQSEESQSNAQTSSHGSQSDNSMRKPEELPTEDNILKTKNRRPRRSGSKVNYDEGREGAADDVDSEEDDWEGEEMEDGRVESTSSDAESESDGRVRDERKEMRQSDDDFEESKVSVRRRSSSSVKKRRHLTKRQERRRRRQTLKETSRITAEDDGHDASLGSDDWWTEVYLEKEQKWICVNGSELQLNRPQSVEQLATKPLSYVVAFDNGDGIKDITKKYASDWLSSVKKIRLDESWWKSVLGPFQMEDCERDVKEEAFVDQQLLKKPMPTTISDFKNHSFYALRRHLLKYEAIYPPTTPILGHIRGEPVYPRDCVHSLHSKEKWRLEGRLVRVDEDPYKIVKARPKWNKPKEFNDRLKLPLYGEWQTEQFIPLPAVDGKIQKNDYGNVEVFKPWMIPGGTIHLPETMNGLGRVAKKLDIDVAPAMVGWDFHAGFNHPILQGWIVCEEHRDVLVAAWEEDQAIQQQKEAEKKQQRVLSNWKLLIRGLLIRERLKKRFDLEEPTVSKKHKAVSLEADDSEEETARDVEEDKATKEETLSWPENLKKRKKEVEEKEKSGRAGDNKHNLFPFEKDHQSSSSA